MEIAFNASLVVLVILYTVLVMAYARVFARGPGGAPRYVRPLLVGTVAVHMAAIALRSIMVRSCPLGSAVEVLTLVAFSISVTYLIIELRIGERCTGVFAITPACNLFTCSSNVLCCASISATLTLYSSDQTRIGIFRLPPNQQCNRGARTWMPTREPKSVTVPNGPNPIVRSPNRQNHR